MQSLAQLSTLPAVALFVIAALLVWAAGSRLPKYVGQLADRLGLQQGLAGMIFLGGITSLPELATAGSAAAAGSPDLAVSNLLGTSSINIMLLVFADALVRRQALAATVRTPSPLIQGVLGMLLMTLAAIVVLVGDKEILETNLGYGSSSLLLACAASIWLASRFERHPGWTITTDTGADAGANGLAGEEVGTRTDESLSALAWKTVAVALVILSAGFVLAQTGDAIARGSGLGAGLTGLVLVGFATSLPELSSVLAAVKLKRFDMAIGDVLGTNIFNVAVLFVVDLAHREGVALAEADPFEAVAALLAVILTALLMLGMLARRNRVFAGIGAAAWSALFVYLAGLALLWTLQASAG